MNGSCRAGTGGAAARPARQGSEPEECPYGDRLRQFTVPQIVPDVERRRRNVDALDLEEVWARDETLEGRHHSTQRPEPRRTY
jgi:hypothetical protein